MYLYTISTCIKHPIRAAIINPSKNVRFSIDLSKRLMRTMQIKQSIEKAANNQYVEL